MEVVPNQSNSPEHNTAEISFKTTEAQRKASRKWESKNVEKVKAYAKEYYQRIKEREKEKYRLKMLDKNTKKLLLLINPTLSI